MKQLTNDVYVLRIRPMGNGDTPTVVYSLTSAETQTSHHFHTLTDLVTFLQETTQPEKKGA